MPSWKVSLNLLKLCNLFIVYLLDIVMGVQETLARSENVLQDTFVWKTALMLHQMEPME